NSGKDMGAFKTLVRGVDQGRGLEIVALLNKNGLETETTQTDTGGVGIQVREKQYPLAVLVLERSQLLHTDDFSLFDKTDWAASSYEKRVKYMRAVSGQISRMVSRMDGIRWAQAHITLPPEKLFTSRYIKDKASANVMLELEPMRKLSSGQTASIINLVMGHVPELDISQISITDTKGHVYSSKSGDPDSPGYDSGGQLSTLTAAFTSAIESRVQDYLDNMVGFGKSKVAVSTRVTSQKTTKQITTFSSGAVGTRKYSEEALGDAALQYSEDGSYLFKSPQPKPVEGMSSEEGYDARLQKDRPDSGYSNIQDTSNNVINNASNNGLDTGRYQCASSDEVCKRNYRKHNLAVQNYPSYEQTQIEAPPGRLERIKVSVVIEEGAIPVGLNELKSVIAAAADPDMSLNDVEIILRPAIKNNAEPKKKDNLVVEAFNEQVKGGFKWWWIPIILILIIIVFSIFRAIGSALVGKPKTFRDKVPFKEQQSNTNNGFPQANTQSNTYSQQPPPQKSQPSSFEERLNYGMNQQNTQAPNPLGSQQQQPTSTNPNPPQTNTNQQESFEEEFNQPKNNEDSQMEDLPFDLDDEFSLEDNENTKQEEKPLTDDINKESTKPQQTKPNIKSKPKPRITIEDQ
ncbi:MAG TPA: hypothetical protein V6C96_01025, partial [Vampirovibrionales bacterium]